MSFNSLFKVLESFCPISPELQRAIIKEMTPLSLPRNYLLHEAPRIADYAYFIVSGYATSFFYHKGKRRIQSIWIAGEIMFLPTSFIERVPSTEHIELAEDSELICISFPSVIRLFNDFPETNTIYRKVINRYLDTNKQRLIDLDLLTAKERFNKLLSMLPDIEQILPQEDLASYLNITPQSLSRIKRTSNTR